MTRVLGSLAFAAAIAVAAGAFAQAAAPIQPAPVQSTTVNNVPVSGVATPAPSATPAPGADGKTNLLGNYQDAQPKMPVLAQPGTAPPKDCGTSGC